MVEENLVLLLMALPFIASIIAATLPVDGHRAAAWVSGLCMAGALLISVSLWPVIETGETIRATIRWIPALGLNLQFRMDGFAWGFVTLVLSIAVLVVIYARYYLSKNDPVPRFYSFLMAFAGAMLGVLLSGNILMLVVFWEMTSLTSFLLIGYWHQGQAARDGAKTALLVTAAGGLCLLLAMLLLGQIAGSYSLDRILAAGDVIRGHALYPLVLVLFLLGAFTKSAQFPFHFWLPGAMAAPTPVSAFLHSATMVKAGVFVMLRFFPALGGSDLWFTLVTGTGLFTLLFASLVALFRHDLKGLLAWSTISHLGLITALIGLGTTGAIFAAVFHIANHAVFKASLFMSAGIIDHETGTRDMRRLSGLWRLMPITGILVALGAAAMAGVPLLNGFLSKEMLFTQAVDFQGKGLIADVLPWVVVAAGVCATAYSLRLVYEVFFGPEAKDLDKTPHEPPVGMRRPVEILVALCLLVGTFPSVIARFIDVPARAILGANVELPYIALWHGFNLPLLMSAIALGGGVLLYVLARKAIAAGPEGPPLLHRIRAQRVFDFLLLELSWRGPRHLYRAISTNRLQPQLWLLVVIATLFAAYGLWGQLAQVADARHTPLNGLFLALWIVGAACAMGAAWQAKYHRFASLVLLGGAGLVTCFTFAWFSAPDLAVTQLLVEVVTTVLLLLGLRWLPKRLEELPDDEHLVARMRRLRDFLVAGIAGGGIAAVAYVVMTRPLVPNIGDWFLRNAYYEGGGTNVVNVILVDFRAFDTFGEITVLAIVGLTVYALLRRFRPAQESRNLPDRRGLDGLYDYLFVPSIIIRWMFPAVIVFAAYLFIRGHDMPGGGFSAGVTMAIAILLQYLAHDVRWTEARLTVLPIRWMGVGLLIAGATGLGALFFGFPFLSAHAQYVDLPLIGKVPAATAMLFDVGVLALVIGATVLMLVALAHQSLRMARLREHEAEIIQKSAAQEVQ